MLAGALTGIMLAGAARQRPASGVSAVTYRKSFMTGFAFEVGRRLAAAEAEAVSESRRGRPAEPTDSQCAEAELRRRFPTPSRVPGAASARPASMRGVAWAVRSTWGTAFRRCATADRGITWMCW